MVQQQQGSYGATDDTSTPSAGNGVFEKVLRSSSWMKPSPHSTDRSSRENLDLLVTEDTEALLSAQDSPTKDDDSNKKTQTCNRNGVRRIALVTIGVAFALILYSVVVKHDSKLPLSIPTNHDDDTIEIVPSRPKGKLPPLSTLDPVKDLNLYAYDRPDASKPPKVLLLQPNKDTYPTNAWYQNFLMVNDDRPTEIHRVYCIPYIIDAAGMIPGIRLHAGQRTASNTVIQWNVQNDFGLTIGSIGDEHLYSIQSTTPLGVTLAWNDATMHSSIVYGMPFGTVVYDNFGGPDDTNRPAIHSEVPMLSAKVDGKVDTRCDHSEILVDKELELTFDQSDFTWLIVVSEPVMMQCHETKEGGVRWEVMAFANGETHHTSSNHLVLRAALIDFCSTGRNPIHCGVKQKATHDFDSYGIGDAEYTALLRTYANAYSGPETDVSFETNQITGMVELTFDWDVQFMNASDTTSELVTFAMMHHFELIQEGLLLSRANRYCETSLVGPVCLYKGSKWHLKYDITPISFRAPRPPSVWALPMIAESLRQDLKYRLPKFYQHGIGDTYFSGKMLAKLARILLVWEEVDEICNPMTPFLSQAYITTCQHITLPSRDEFNEAVTALKSSIEIWLNGTAVTPFVYDPAWGGVASCGCDFDSDTKSCRNKFPECTGFEDPGLNFGNAFYNDMHFHYGYFIMASAAAAHFDPEWGIATHEQVLLLIRCIANPSEDDVYFPTWRFKDFYRGNSWANGIATVYLNGKNQESSSEAIAAYEAIALYGEAMMAAWDNRKSSEARERFNTASDILKIGQLLATTELRSTRTYWHVQSHKNVYPSLYTPHAIGILWQTMAQFQTWFGNLPYLAYGIQLLPLTPISEFRDTVEWGSEMYPTFADSCIQTPSCEKDGWSILQFAMLATLGHNTGAANSTLHIPSSAFESAGGNGHSLTNSLWFVATRPEIKPVPIQLPTHVENENDDDGKPHFQKVKDCGLPKVCTDRALDAAAGDYTCRERINWLIAERMMTVEDACFAVSREFLVECGACAPAVQNECLPCTVDQCHTMNRCPVYERNFVCLEGGARGGCSDVPWEISQEPNAPCNRCCELTDCVK